jgi:hypothetical protein
MLGTRFVNVLLKQFGDGSERLCIVAGEGVPQDVGIFKPLSPVFGPPFCPCRLKLTLYALRTLITLGTFFGSSLPHNALGQTTK